MPTQQSVDSSAGHCDDIVFTCKAARCCQDFALSTVGSEVKLVMCICHVRSREGNQAMMMQASQEAQVC